MQYIINTQFSLIILYNIILSYYWEVNLYILKYTVLLFLLSVGLLVANAPDVLQPCGLLYYP